MYSHDPEPPLFNSGRSIRGFRDELMARMTCAALACMLLVWGMGIGGCIVVELGTYQQVCGGHVNAPTISCHICYR